MHLVRFLTFYPLSFILHPLSFTLYPLPTLLILLTSVSAQAQLTSTEPVPLMEHVTSVSQLADVKPTDWAFQALQSLVERYGCIVGYPDKTFQGNQALTRYEFAAGLNACLDKIQELLATGTAELARREDLETAKKLVEEFAPELAALRGRLDGLDVRSETLQRQQFSTTTKLFGQVVLGVQGRNSPDIELAGVELNDGSDQINVITNVQLSLYTAFSPRSLLLTGLQAGSGRTVSDQLLTNNVLLGYEADTGASVQLSDLTFRHLFGNNFAIVAGAEGVNMVNVFRGANRIESAGQGPLSLFAQRNPILNIGSNGGSGTNAGVGFDWQIGPRFSLQGVYFSNRPEDPANGGILGGDNGGTTAATQLTMPRLIPLTSRFIMPTLTHPLACWVSALAMTSLHYRPAPHPSFVLPSKLMPWAEPFPGAPVVGLRWAVGWAIPTLT